MLLTHSSCKRNQRHPGQNDGSEICTAGTSDSVPWESSGQILGFDTRGTEGRSTPSTQGSDRALGASAGFVPCVTSSAAQSALPLGQKIEAAFLGGKKGSTAHGADGPSRAFKQQ